MHSTGPKRFARIQNKLESEDPSVVLKDSKVFMETRKRRDGKPMSKETLQVIAEMEEIESHQALQEGKSGPRIDALSIVMGPNHPGRLRLYGRGVTMIEELQIQDRSINIRT